jgi:SSS family solute:Na+ symporter
MIYAVVPVLLGMMARIQFPDLAQPELALPTLLMNGVPAFIGALGLAAVFSAELSAADAVLFTLTTSLSQDFYKRFLNPTSSDKQLLRVTRGTAIVGGSAGVAIALVAAGVVSALSIFYTIMGVSLFVPIIAGLYSSQTTSMDALAAIIAGMCIVGGWRLLHGGMAIGGVTPAMGGLAGAIIAFLVAYTLRRIFGSDDPTNRAVLSPTKR